VPAPAAVAAADTDAALHADAAAASPGGGGCTKRCKRVTAPPATSASDCREGAGCSNNTQYDNAGNSVGENIRHIICSKDNNAQQ
jgi:hypothetical protein